VVKRTWFAENGGVWQLDTHRNALGADVELRRHLMCRLGDELALAFNPATHCVVRFGPRDVVEHWVEETNRGRPASNDHAHHKVSVVAFLASAATVSQALQSWEQNADVRSFVEHLRHADQIHYQARRSST
jgi:hypothetical protein